MGSGSDYSVMSLLAFVSSVAMESQLEKPRRPTTQAEDGGGLREWGGLGCVHNTPSLNNADLKKTLFRKTIRNFFWATSPSGILETDERFQRKGTCNKYLLTRQQ